MYTSQLARSLARTAVVAKPHRRFVSTNPPPPPIGPEPVEKKGSAAPFVIGALVAAGGLGYYLTQAKEEGKAPDVSQKARELEEAARAQTQQKIDEGKVKVNGAMAEGRAKVDAVQAGAKDSYNSAVLKANELASETKDRLNSYKNSASDSLHHAKDSTQRGAQDAKASAEAKGKEAQSTWWSWLGWGSEKKDEAKSAAAGKVAEGAAGVKEKAAEAEKSAAKRT